MTAYDTSNSHRSDPEPSTVSANIIAYSASDGRVIIYDQHEQSAWVSSTCAIPLQNAS